MQVTVSPGLCHGLLREPPLRSFAHRSSELAFPAKPRARCRACCVTPLHLLRPRCHARKEWHCFLTAELRPLPNGWPRSQLGCDGKPFAQAKEPKAIAALEGWVHKLLTDASLVALPPSTSILQVGTAANCAQSGAAWLPAALETQVQATETPEKACPELRCHTETARCWKVPRWK
jgi:hypothetical protein